jgi:hypothetical protein
MSTLEERLEQGAAKAWRPDESDPNPVVGTVTNVEMGASEYGSYPIVTIQTEAGEEFAIHGFRTVLKNEFMKQRPQPGERIGVKDLGEQATKPGSKFKSYHGYVLKVERAQGSAFDWNRLGAPVDDSPLHDPYAQEPQAAPDVALPANAGSDDIPF